jgi:hypothetical protein
MLGVALLVATGAGAALSAVSLTVTPSSVRPGHIVIIRGNAGDCPVGDAVTILSQAFRNTQSFAGVPAVFARVRAGGRFGIRPRIPAQRQVGRYDVTARCGGGNLGVLAHLRVRA